MNKELEIYIHIPFCVRKCRYCDFLSGPAGNETKDRYMEALCREILEKSSEYVQYTVTSVFIGGGTPSCVNPAWIGKVMELIKEQYCLSEEAEISMEVNPGTVSRQALEVYYESGINRLSIGLQSARSEELTVLGRIHTYEQFTETYFAARKVGFSNINVDIMSGLPGQTLEHYGENLSKITGLEPPPEHISAYSLIVEEGTPFYEEYEKGTLELPEEDTEREMYEITGTFLRQKGYERYEISNYARPGRECRHNVGYWTRKNYVGFGIGAASLVENVRFKNTDELEDYVNDPCCCMEDIQELTIREQMEETMFLGLRLADGVSGQRFHDTFGVSPEEVYGKVIEKHVENGLLEICDEKTVAVSGGGSAPGTVTNRQSEKYIRLTKKGMDVSNYVMADFLEP